MNKSRNYFSLLAHHQQHQQQRFHVYQQQRFHVIKKLFMSSQSVSDINFNPSNHGKRQVSQGVSPLTQGMRQRKTGSHSSLNPSSKIIPSSLLPSKETSRQSQTDEATTTKDTNQKNNQDQNVYSISTSDLMSASLHLGKIRIHLNHIFTNSHQVIQKHHGVLQCYPISTEQDTDFISLIFQKPWHV